MVFSDPFHTRVKTAQQLNEQKKKKTPKTSHLLLQTIKTPKCNQ